MMQKLTLILIILLLLPVYSFAGTFGNSYIHENKLDVSIDPANSRISGSSLISVREGLEFSLDLSNLKINYIRLNNEPFTLNENEPVIRIVPVKDGILEIRYEAVFRSTRPPDDSNPGAIESVIDERGISLTGLWYPRVMGLSKYSLTATLPERYEAISEADEITKVKKDGFVEFHFEFPYPLQGINFVASDRYSVLSDNFNSIKIYSYFFKEDSGLAEEYIEFTKQYLKLYEDIVGKFPFRRFSIVENFLPTGFSMPTFTLLGNRVVRLPFIVETSLGHEILHQWFGNLVYIDHDGGNWAEGLTTYLADHMYKELEGSGWEYRKHILIDYMSYVNDDNDFPLKNFSSRFDHASKAVGYGKAAMVFHMLKNSLGKETFFKALQEFIRNNRFREASWNDLRLSFEKGYGSELDYFFSQWVEMPGLPEVYLQEVELRSHGDSFELSFRINQKGNVFNLDVPVTIYVKGRGVKRFFRITEEENDFRVFLSNEPEKIVIDEDYDIARRLHEDELSPVIAGLLGAKELLVSLPAGDGDIYQDIVDEFKGKGAEVKSAGDITDSEIKSSSVVVLGYDNPLISRFYGRLEPPVAGFSITIRKNPWNPGGVVGLFYGRSKEEVRAGFRKMRHYGKYSEIFFEAGNNKYKRTNDSPRGIIMDLKESIPAIEVSTISTLKDVIEKVSEKRIIYVGEFHDVFAHHAVQLDIIRDIFSKNNNIAIGMEMFQRPFQKSLDDYIEGRIDEREFLGRTEYFKRWRLDYNLYRPILRFARLNRIPVVALNMEREIINKVSKDGIDSLTESERNKIPAGMDFSDSAYTERIRGIFKYHKNWKDKNFDFFYQSQIMWDETMSLSIDEFLRNNPDRQMIVIAGQGHLEFGSGIPKRTLRRNGETYAIILIDADIADGIADHVVFPKPVKGITSPRLMAFLNIEGDILEITGFPEESVSKKAGLKEGDIIIFLDDYAVSSIEDIKLHLFYKKKDEVVMVKVLRGEKDEKGEMEFRVKL